jgi:ankyrin repeat domain-containing protein 50
MGVWNSCVHRPFSDGTCLNSSVSGCWKDNYCVSGPCAFSFRTLKNPNSALVIDMLEALSREAGSRICVAYVYIRYSDRDQVTVRGILEVLVKQTYERKMDSRALIQAAYARHVEESTQPTEKELLDLLRELSGRMTATFYVLDALDEAPIGVRLDIVRKLASLEVRLFITSRPLQALEARFPNAHTFTIVAQDQDLDLHIAHKIETSESLQDLLQECQPAFKQELVDTVKSKCGGMCVSVVFGET